MPTCALLIIGWLFSTGDIKPATKAKDFTVSSLSGEKISLAQLRGKVVLLNFWATWCAPCREELPQLSALQEKLRARGLVVLAVSVDDERENIANFLQENGIKLPAWWDRDQRVSRLYNPQTMPASFVIDRNGVLRFVHNGYSASELKRLVAEINQLLGPRAPLDVGEKNKS